MYNRKPTPIRNLANQSVIGGTFAYKWDLPGPYVAAFPPQPQWSQETCTAVIASKKIMDAWGPGSADRLRSIYIYKGSMSRWAQCTHMDYIAANDGVYGNVVIVIGDHVPVVGEDVGASFSTFAGIIGGFYFGTWPMYGDTTDPRLIGGNYEYLDEVYNANGNNLPAVYMSIIVVNMPATPQNIPTDAIVEVDLIHIDILMDVIDQEIP